MIVVLGCSAKGGKPSKMLRDRLDKAISLYNEGVSETILMSGDESTGYSEVQVMKDYAIKNGVPEENIKLDNTGYSTIDSMRNLRDKYDVSRIVVVSQKYHLYRAVFIADEFGFDVIGVSADNVQYKGNAINNVREVFARVKDFVAVLVD